MDKILTAIAARIADKLMPVIVEQVTALLPAIVGAAVKAVFDKVPSLPDLDLSEVVRDTVNQLPDVDLPIVSDIFDLTEWLKGHYGG